MTILSVSSLTLGFYDQIYLKWCIAYSITSGEIRMSPLKTICTVAASSLGTFTQLQLRIYYFDYFPFFNCTQICFCNVYLTCFIMPYLTVPSWKPSSLTSVWGFPTISVLVHTCCRRREAMETAHRVDADSWLRAAITVHRAFVHINTWMTVLCETVASRARTVETTNEIGAHLRTPSIAHSTFIYVCNEVCNELQQL